MVFFEDSGVKAILYDLFDCCLNIDQNFKFSSLETVATVCPSGLNATI